MNVLKTALGMDYEKAQITMVATPPPPTGGSSLTPLQDRVFTVQFNPETLTLTSSPNGIVRRGMVARDDLGTTQQERRVKGVSLGLQLVFDDVEVADAFMFDKVTTTPLAMARNIYAMTHTFSVRQKINAFIAASLNPAYQKMIFCWGKFIFDGMVNEINARYTMFNPKGEPIRGTVELRVEQGVDDTNTERYKEFFEKTFGGGGLDAAADMGVAGNLISF